MKVTMTLEDGPNSRPMFDAKTEGVDPEMKSLAYSLYAFIRMALDVLNSPYRSQLVSLIAVLHKSINDVEVINGGGSDGASDSGHIH